jgi:hypothetical protein
MRPHSVLATATAVVSCAVALASPAAAQDPPVQDPVPIRPNQFFQGQVKGVHAGAEVFVVCPGPTSPGRLGHPVAGQPVEVVLGPSPTAAGGYTGSLGTSVVAAFGPASSVGAPQRLTFTSAYAPQDIPTTFWLPCDGTQKVPFTPQPTSTTAITDYVTVTYVNIAV